ncbi:MAG: hypothetical protein ACRD3E_00465 [Terriglobales bacterium]
MRTDPRFDLERYHEDALGIRTTGWVLLTFAGLLWIFVFISIRNGTMLFPAWATAQTLVGFALVGLGTQKENVTAVEQARMAPREIRNDGENVA